MMIILNDGLEKEGNRKIRTKEEEEKEREEKEGCGKTFD